MTKAAKRGVDAIEWLGLKKKPEQNLHILTGEEQYLKRRVIQSLSERTENQVILNNPSLPEVLAYCTANPLFDSTQTVLIRDSGIFTKASEAQIKKLATASNILIAEAPSIDRRTKIGKLLAKYEIECSLPDQTAIVRWIRQRIKAEKFKMSDSAVKELINRAAVSFDNLNAELEKLSITFFNQSTVKASDVQKHVIDRNPGITVWKFLDSLLRENDAAALDQARYLFANQQELAKIVGLLTWKLKQVWKFVGVVESGSSRRDAALKVGVPKFTINEFLGYTRKLTESHCQVFLDHLFELGRRSAGYSDQQQTLEYFVIKLCNSFRALAKNRQ